MVSRHDRKKSSQFNVGTLTTNQNEQYELTNTDTQQAYNFEKTTHIAKSIKNINNAEHHMSLQLYGDAAPTT